MSIPGSASPLFLSAAAAAAPSAYQIDRSLRFNSGDSAYLNRTPSSAGNRKTWTWSGWVKRSALQSGTSNTYMQLFAAGTGSTARDVFFFDTDTDDTLAFYSANGFSASVLLFRTNAVFRDASAWYHVVLSVDTTQATAANRIKLYINGIEQSFSTANYPSQNAQGFVNQNNAHYIGTHPPLNQYLNGYLTDVHFIDGQALAASDFGEYDSNNVWQPKAYSGTYGTNGFHLPFSDNSSNAALGYDAAATQPAVAPKGGMDVVTYTGNGGTQTISGLGFQPDFVWTSVRDLTGYNKYLVDSVRGSTKVLISHSTAAESTQSTGITSFNSDGFSLGSNAQVNENGRSMVAWCWKAGGTAVSNTDGTITSSVSANTDYGFSIVSYTGNGTDNATVGHGLGSTPAWLIQRDLTGGNWQVWHQNLASGSFDRIMNLNTTDAVATVTNRFRGANSSTFTLGTSGDMNGSGQAKICYCWSEVSGFSKFDTYSGGTANQTISTGFKPRYLLIKRTDAANSWLIFDSARGVNKVLKAESNVAETTASSGLDEIEFLSNGFKLVSTNNGINGSGGTYIYAAFADRPGNNWTPNNLSVATGANNDSLIDTPTDYEADSGNNGGNYATLNPVDKGGDSSATVTDGNLKWFGGTTTNHAISRSTIGVSSGKWYVEVTIEDASDTSGRDRVGVVSSEENVSITNPVIGNFSTGYGYRSDGFKENNGSSSSYGASYTTGDTIGIALDMDTGSLVFYKNGSSQGTAYTSIGGTMHFCGTPRENGTYVFNFGQRPFAYTPPTGYKSLCTTNLPDSTIADGSTAMDVVTYSGTSATRSFTDFNFSPDFAWIKTRNVANDHNLVDIVRGAPNILMSNKTDAEITNSTDGFVSFDSNGFTLGANSLGTQSDELNKTGFTYVGWAWDGGTSTVSNTDGSITSSVRANPSAGFSIVTYAGAGAVRTVGHGLNAAPELIIFKSRTNSENWAVYSKANGAGNRLIFNLNVTSAAGSNYFNNTEATSSVFTVGHPIGQVNGSGQNYVAYCFAPVEGYSAFGKYTGNGSTNGPFVYTGFRPRFILVKITSGIADDWTIIDSERIGYNDDNYWLYASSSSAEYSGSFSASDILSNGFKPRSTGNQFNANGSTYIYAAFAEHPFKTARAR